jgi:hypothetical protein
MPAAAAAAAAAAAHLQSTAVGRVTAEKYDSQNLLEKNFHFTLQMNIFLSSLMFF